MDQYHEPRRKKVSSGSGGRKRPARDKKLAHVGRRARLTKVSDKEVREKVRSRGGNEKILLKKAAYVNVVTKDGVKKAKILSVLESSRAEYARENIITKGAILNTEIGKVKVTNRPGQDGVVNGTLIS